jgi:hypothetical protein
MSRTAVYGGPARMAIRTTARIDAPKTRSVSTFTTAFR